MNKSILLFLALFALLSLGCRLATVGSLAETVTPTGAPAKTITAAPKETAPVMTRFRAPVMVTATPALQVCRVTAEALNVRECPALSCPAVAWLRDGEMVQPFTRAGGWLQVAAGWIHGDYVTCEVLP